MYLFCRNKFISVKVKVNFIVSAAIHAGHTQDQILYMVSTWINITAADV